MKSFSANCRLLIATTGFILLPHCGVAQEGTPPVVGPQRYVSDKLVLNVYAEAEQGSARVATIQTGDAVEELERVGNLVHVRLEDGKDGWVGANYLTDEPPAIVQLRELRQQKGVATPAPVPAPVVDKKSLEEIAALKKEKAALQAKVTELQSKPVAPLAPPPEVVPEVARAPSPSPTQSAAGMSLIWPIALVLTAALSFAAGYQTFARRINRKFGGLKII